MARSSGDPGYSMIGFGSPISDTRPQDLEQNRIPAVPLPATPDAGPAWQGSQAAQPSKTPAQPVGHPFRYRDRREVRVGAGHFRHHRGVDHPQPGRADHPALRVHH